MRPLRLIGVAGAYLFGHLRQRNPRLWVFGNIKGFRDNPRYLAEHVAACHPDLQPLWIARTSREAQAARAAGIAVAILGEPDARRLQRRAGAAFLSNGFQDLEAVHLGGAYVVDLRHGKGLKRILLDREEEARSSSAIGRFSRASRRWFVARRLGQVDMIVAGGEWAKEMYVSAFRCPPSRVQVLGLPRYDVILGGPAYDRVAGRDLRERLAVSPGQHLALWLPTWRERDDDRWLPPLAARQVEAAWSGADIVLLVKPHPYTDPDLLQRRLPDHPMVRILPEEEIDVNALLRAADSLVTDYSSAAFDFAILDRPIHFFVPDIDDYREGKGLYEPLDVLTHGHHHTAWSGLLQAVANSARDRDDGGRAVARRIRARSRNNDAPGSNERIAAAVAKALGLHLDHGAKAEAA